MTALANVPVAALSLERFVSLIGYERVAEARAPLGRLRASLPGRVIWNVSSDASVGGCAAEVLRSLVAFSRGENIDARWMTFHGSAAFCASSIRIHKTLQGRGDALVPTDEERRSYEATTAATAAELACRTTVGDVILLHDPATAGMAPLLVAHGCQVVWFSHVASDRSSAATRAAWAFLHQYLAGVRRLVFSRSADLPLESDAARMQVIHPSLDPFSTKNSELDHHACRAILEHVGLLASCAPRAPHVCFTCEDGSGGRVRRCADVVRSGPPSLAEVPMVLQLTRWERFEDSVGLVRAFGKVVERADTPEATLVLAGPDAHATSADPGAAAVHQRVVEAWYALSHAVRARIQIAMLPTDDVDEHAAIVNSLQRHATVVVQTNTREALGLTVTEAMWKERAVIAARVGGADDQIIPDESGILLDDPTDLASLATAIVELLSDASKRSRLGACAKERVYERYLKIRELREYAELLLDVAA